MSVHAIFLVFAVTALQAFTFTAEASKAHRPLLGLVPDAPSTVYQKAYRERRLRYFYSETQPTAVQDPVQLSVAAGERNLNWLKHMNSLRPADQQIRWTKPGDNTGHPIDKADRYSDQTVAAELTKIRAEAPPEMARVIFEGAEFTDNLPLDEANYILWARRLDRNYQTATRWLMMQPYLNELAGYRAQDVRGYYFLSRVEHVEDQLRMFNTLPEEQKTAWTEYLILICYNSQGAVAASCTTELTRAIGANAVLDYYLKYLPGAKELWDSFFEIPKSRHDLTWTSANPDLLSVPFQPPDNAAIQDFLSVNIEDEWTWGTWHLRLNFTTDALVHVKFEPGVTPHVNDIAGDIITMDENTPLTEWDVQWTIRHEFGHVLGFEDCYVEFYEPSTKSIVNYQLDVTNLMCSRMGKIQQKHFDELKKNYLKEISFKIDRYLRD